MIVNPKTKDHNIYLNKVALVKLNKEELTLLNLYAYYLEEANNYYRTSMAFKKKLCSLYDSVFQIFISNLGKYTRIIYSFSFIDSNYLNDDDYDNNQMFDFFEKITSYPLMVKNNFSKRLFNSVKKDYRDDLLAAEENHGYKAKVSFLDKLLINTDIILTDEGALSELLKLNIDDLYAFYLRKIKPLSFSYYTNYLKAPLIYQKENSYDYSLKTVINSKEEINYVKANTGECYINLAINTNLYYGDEDYLYGFLLNTILGGGMNSLLFKEIREKYSLCYSIGSKYNSNLGLIFVTLITDKDNSLKAVNLIKDILNNLDFTKESFNIAVSALIDSVISKDDYPYSSLIDASIKEYFSFYLSGEEKIAKLKNLDYEYAKALASKMTMGLVSIYGGNLDE